MRPLRVQQAGFGVVTLFGLIALAATAIPARGETPAPTTQPKPNELSRAERAGGWKLLFDGKTSAGWRGYKQKDFPAQGWTVADGILQSAGGSGTDLISTDEYGDFELTLEWRIAAKGNSGVMYRVTEAHDAPWQSGPEFQLLDDAGAGVTADSAQSAGAVFDLFGPAAAKVSQPAGEFNTARIVLRDGLLQHWLDGVKVVECRLDSADWKQRVAASKFGAYSDFATAARGHIALQDHGDAVAFRNIKIRDLAAPMPGEVRLFNGHSLAGWAACLADGKTKKEDVWSVADGVLICKGQPQGYLRTEKDYTNYVLKVEWRFDPVTKKAGNSGVLLRIIGPDKVWPRCIEAQLESGNAGDFWDIDEFPMKGDPQRTSGRNTKKLHGAEHPVGEWNEYEIIVDGGHIVLNVNGEMLNEAWDALETPGKIGLQSEGAEIHFRNVRLVPLEPPAAHDRPAQS